MIESTQRPAWTQTIWQGMGNGLESFKHKIASEKGETVIKKDYDYTANANTVPAN